jgi:hypothetical protein
MMSPTPALGIELERDDGNDNIPIGDDPDRHASPIHALHDQQISHMVHAHELSSFLNGGLPCCRDIVVIGQGCMHETLGRLRSNAYSIVRESPCPVVRV